MESPASIGPSYIVMIVVVANGALHFSTGAERVFGCWLQLMHCTYLVLLSEYFRCVPGTPRIPEVSEVVQESEVIWNWSIFQRGECRGQV